MIVAVTGANGFIGRHLQEQLTGAGHLVRPIVRQDIAGALLPRLLDGADVAIHAAGATRAPTHRALRESNVELTRQVIEAARTAAVGRFVLVSSQAAAGPASKRDEPVTEADPPAPMEEYGRTKRAAEALVRASGIPFAVVRPAAVYGPGDRDFQTMFRLARRGIALHPGNRDQWISIIHVHDCVDGIIRAATSPAALGHTYFLANDRPVQWRELFRLVRDAAGGSLLVDVEIPSALVDVGARIGDLAARFTGSAGLLTSEKVALGKPAFWICSNERARRELGFTPRVELRTGIAETYRWYLENDWL